MFPRQLLDYLRVARREVERAQVPPSRPAHLLSELRRRLPGELTAQEVQLHCAIWVCMRRHEHLLADHCGNAKFLQKLAPQTEVDRFTGVAFAAGELPASGQVRAGQPACEQEMAVALDDR